MWIVWSEKSRKRVKNSQTPNARIHIDFVFVVFLQLILQNLKFIHFTQAKADDHWNHGSTEDWTCQNQSKLMKYKINKWHQIIDKMYLNRYSCFKFNCVYLHLYYFSYFFLFLHFPLFELLIFKCTYVHNHFLITYFHKCINSFIYSLFFLLFCLHFCVFM